MKCIVCDRCGEIIKSPRNIRVITCARPLKSPIEHCGVGDKPVYRGNDRQQNDILWEKELCSTCIDTLEAFFEPTNPDVPDNPVDPGEGGTDTPVDPDAGEGGETP